MTHTTSILERLMEVFTAKELMVPEASLVTAEDASTAALLLKENVQFDVVAIRNRGFLTDYLERGRDVPKTIDLQVVVSSGTGLFDVVHFLVKKPFVFVLVGQRIGGYIHISDLNNPRVKLSYYVLMEAIEQTIVSRISPLINESNLADVLDPDKRTRVVKKMREMRKKRADYGWPSLLSFGEILRFARLFGQVHLTHRELEQLTKVRNLISHATEPLISSHDDVRRLVEAEQIGLKILSETAEPE